MDNVWRDKCFYCEEPILKSEPDRLVMVLGSGEMPAHQECSMRQIIGSVGHQKGECSCKGVEDTSEIGKSKRQAAIEAYEYFTKHIPKMPIPQVTTADWMSRSAALLHQMQKALNGEPAPITVPEGTTGPAKYILVDGVSRIEIDLMAWAEWMEHSPERVVKQTHFPPDICVSTIFLGLDHNHFGVGGPILWETMVFNGALHLDGIRASSREEALKNHEEFCRRVREAEATVNRLISDTSAPRSPE